LDPQGNHREIMFYIWGLVYYSKHVHWFLFLVRKSQYDIIEIEQYFIVTCNFNRRRLVSPASYIIIHENDILPVKLHNMECNERKYCGCPQCYMYLGFIKHNSSMWLVCFHVVYHLKTGFHSIIKLLVIFWCGQTVDFGAIPCRKNTEKVQSESQTLVFYTLKLEICK